jgi:hypothetical protein
VREVVRTSALLPRAIDLTELLTELVEVLARRVVGVVYDLDGRSQQNSARPAFVRVLKSFSSEGVR